MSQRVVQSSEIQDTLIRRYILVSIMLVTTIRSKVINVHRGWKHLYVMYHKGRMVCMMRLRFCSETLVPMAQYPVVVRILAQNAPINLPMFYECVAAITKCSSGLVPISDK